MQTDPSEYYSDSFESRAYDTTDDELRSLPPRSADHPQDGPDVTQQARNDDESQSQSSADEAGYRSSPTDERTDAEDEHGPATPPPAAVARVATAASETPHNDDAFNVTVAMRASPLRQNNLSRGGRHNRPTRRHSTPDPMTTTTAHDMNSTTMRRTGGGGKSPQRQLTKIQKYAVEEGIFAPLHAAINDSKLQDLVTRLYDPKTLRNLTLRAAEQRRESVTSKQYNSLNDAHLSHYWQRKCVFKEQIRQEHETAKLVREQQVHLSRNHTSNNKQQHPVAGREGGFSTLPELVVRPATCPPLDQLQQMNESPPRRASISAQEGSSLPPPGHVGDMPHDHAASGDEASHRSMSTYGSPTSAENSPSPPRRRPQSAASTTSSRGSRASSPDWQAQRAGADPSAIDGAAANGGPTPVTATRSLQLPRVGSAARSSRTGASSVGQWAAVTTVKRSDLCALWMAARPPSPFQRLMSRLSYNPNQEFSLGWLVQRKNPPEAGTLRDIPLRPPPNEEDAGKRLRISSPRSAYVMLRQGIMTEDVIPVSLQRFYLEGSLKGIPPTVAEYHFAAREKLRRGLVDELLGAYNAICATISQEAFIAKLYAVNPEEHRDARLSREQETICGGKKSRRKSQPSSKASSVRQHGSSPDASVSRKHQVLAGSADDPTAEGPLPAEALIPTSSVQASERDDSHQGTIAVEEEEEGDTAAAKRRIEQTMEKQQRRQDKYMRQLERNATLLRERATQAQRREEVADEKHKRLLEQRAVERQKRKEVQEIRQATLVQKRQDAKTLEKEKQTVLLQRIHEGELHAKALHEKREQLRFLHQEERKIQDERKGEIVARREKQHDYENLLLIDRIRRKTGRAHAMEQMRTSAMKDLKERRERNLIDMAARTSEFAAELLAHQRRNMDTTTRTATNHARPQKSSSVPLIKESSQLSSDSLRREETDHTVLDSEGQTVRVADDDDHLIETTAKENSSKVTLAALDEGLNRSPEARERSRSASSSNAGSSSRSSSVSLHENKDKYGTTPTPSPPPPLVDDNPSWI